MQNRNNTSSNSLPQYNGMAFPIPPSNDYNATAGFPHLHNVYHATPEVDYDGFMTVALEALQGNASLLQQNASLLQQNASLQQQIESLQQQPLRQQIESLQQQNAPLRQQIESLQQQLEQVRCENQRLQELADIQAKSAHKLGHITFGYFYNLLCRAYQDDARSNSHASLFRCITKIDPNFPKISKAVFTTLVRLLRVKDEKGELQLLEQKKRDSYEGIKIYNLKGEEFKDDDVIVNSRTVNLRALINAFNACLNVGLGQTVFVNSLGYSSEQNFKPVLIKWNTQYTDLVELLEPYRNHTDTQLEQIEGVSVKAKLTADILRSLALGKLKNTTQTEATQIVAGPAMPPQNSPQNSLEDSLLTPTFATLHNLLFSSPIKPLNTTPRKDGGLSAGFNQTESTPGTPIQQLIQGFFKTPESSPTKPASSKRRHDATFSQEPQDGPEKRANRRLHFGEDI